MRLIQLIRRSDHPGSAKRCSNAPPTIRSSVKTPAINPGIFGEGWESAWRKSRVCPVATAAPAFISAARVEAHGQMSRARPATARLVPSGSPEAATMTSTLPSARAVRQSKVRRSAAASFRAGMMIESCTVPITIRGGVSARDSARPPPCDLPAAPAAPRPPGPPCPAAAARSP